MLKSLITQFAATLFFGPIGLVYSSVAGAVFLTLLFAVLYFTELGVIAALIVWPIAIIAGLISVKLHNDQVRSSGSRLLLGPDDEGSVISTLGSWGRGVAVLALIGAVGFLVFWQGSKNTGSRDEAPGSMADSAPSDSSTTKLTGSVDDLQVINSSANNSADSQGDSSGNRGELEIATTEVIDPDAPVVTTVSEPANESFAVVSLDQQEVTPVVIGTSSTRAASDAAPETESSGPEVIFSEVGGTGPSLYVGAAVVNLREGPGTNHSIVSQLERGEPLREISRAGRWINVTTTNSGTTGWIFDRLVGTQR